MPKSLKFLWLLYVLELIVFAVFSYGLTVPNLILSSNSLFWQFQTWMWQTFFNNHPLLTQTYVIQIIILFLTYSGIIHQVKILDQTWSWKKWTSFAPWYFLLLLPMWFGYNALSADIFNYIFDARIITLHHANPYQSVALNYPEDTWTRFMHNTHTTSPYGWGWTILSVGLYMLGLGKFLVTWLIFKGSAILSLGVLPTVYSFSQNQRSRNYLTLIFLVILNPLVILEYGLMGHNDLWMMVPAVLSLLMLANSKFKRSWVLILISFLLLVLSISMKFATELLIPIWLLLVLVRFDLAGKFKAVITTWWPVAAAVLMFLPLLYARSQYFNPWYLIWPLIWVPFFPQLENGWVKHVSRFLIVLLLCFSVTSMLRYIPWLQTGGYEGDVLLREYLITWSAVPLAMLGYALIQLKRK